MSAGVALRIASALVPLAALKVSQWIIDLIVEVVKHPGPIPHQIWTLVGIEFALAAGNSLLGRAIDYSDTRLADEFTREVSVRVIEHATHLDLASFEDPALHDKLERARSQATDRIAMLQSL
ncbi:MAG: ABC transporter ATP-binding protein, partial [Pseudomonadota bacterium]